MNEWRRHRRSVWSRAVDVFGFTEPLSVRQRHRVNVYIKERYIRLVDPPFKTDLPKGAARAGAHVAECLRRDIEVGILTKYALLDSVNA